MKRNIFVIILVLVLISTLCTATYAGTKTKKRRMQEETVEAFLFRIGDDHSPSMKDYPPKETVEPCPLK